MQHIARMLQRPTAQDAVLLAGRRFQAAERIDMGAIADELGVNRVTLYRWVGSRERLLVEVLWSLADATLARRDAEVRATGAERIVAIVTRFINDCLTNPGMQHLLGEEGEQDDAAADPPRQGLSAAAHRCHPGDAGRGMQAGRLDLPADLHDVAYVVVRVIESYVYLDLITGEEPDARRAEPVLRLLLR